MSFKFKIFILSVVLNFFQHLSITSQNSEIDSLMLLLKNSKQDTARVRLNLEIAALLYNDKPDMAFIHCKKALEIAELSQHAKSIKDAYAWNAIIYQRKGDLARALYYYEKAIKIQEKIGDYSDYVTILNNVAQLLIEKGDIIKAMGYFQKGLKIFAELRMSKGNVVDKNSEANIILNLASLYKKQGEDSMAMNYYLKSLQMFEETNSKQGKANCYNNIGILYQQRNDLTKALRAYRLCLRLNEELGNQLSIARSLNNIGSFYSNFGDPEIISKNDSRKVGYQKALEYMSRGLKIQNEIGDLKGSAYALHNMSAIYFNQNNKSKALQCAEMNMQIAKKLRFPEILRNAAHSLTQVYKATGNDKLALQNFELYIQMRDSINNESTRKASIKSQLKYEYEKQAAADSVAHAKESEIKNVQLQKQGAEIKAKKNQQYALFGGLGLVIVFAGFMYNRFKITQKQKSIIEQQKEIVEEQKKMVEEKQKEILDSISYARRIQMALIPSEKYIERIMKKLKHHEGK